MQYNIWFLTLSMLIIPFLPVNTLGFQNLQNWMIGLHNVRMSNQNGVTQTLNNGNQLLSGNWLQDFSISINSKTPSYINVFLISIWTIGIIVMTTITIYNNHKIKQLKTSSLPVQNQKIRLLCKICVEDIGLKNELPILTSAYLNTPVTMGHFKPCIILPMYLISEFKLKEIRYILLHELQHYKHRDIQVNLWMCLTQIIYWFNPVIWYVLKEMRNDCELACDSSVLSMLDKEYHSEYGHTLLNFAQKLSYLSSVSGMGGPKKQIKKRIINIVSFQGESQWLKLKSILIFILIGITILGFTPILSTHGFNDSIYKTSNIRTTTEDLSDYFKDYNGSFVLYEPNKDYCFIYNETDAMKRVSPDSTYKIYSALFGLEANSISPHSSLIMWDKIIYPYDTWNQDHSLNTAMKNSVNWYFQALDQRTGLQTLKHYYQKIEYGNQSLSGGISNYWMESSLKISPMEQVELLSKFYYNTFQFEDKNIQTVKDAMSLSSSNEANLYGKTGTGSVDGKNVNGWFVGFIEVKDNTYFFATHIQNNDKSNGSNAANITLSILKDKNIYSSE